MANQEHLKIIKKGVKVWNKWVAEHLEAQPDLSDTNLSRLDLSGIYLSGTKLRRTDLGGAYLQDANLANA